MLAVFGRRAPDRAPKGLDARPVAPAHGDDVSTARAIPPAQRREAPRPLAAAQLVRLVRGQHVGKPPVLQVRPQHLVSLHRLVARVDEEHAQGQGVTVVQVRHHQALPALPHRLRDSRVSVSREISEVKLLARPEEVHHLRPPWRRRDSGQSLRPRQRVQHAALADVRTAQQRHLRKPVAGKLLAGYGAPREADRERLQCVRPSRTSPISGAGSTVSCWAGAAGGTRAILKASSTCSTSSTVNAPSTFVGMSDRSFSFSRGRMIVVIPMRCAARSFSLTPPMGNTLPRRVISPVMATSRRTGCLVRADTSAVAMVIPAEGPSLGMAPSGTWMWMSILRLNPGARPSLSARERT